MRTKTLLYRKTFVLRFTSQSNQDDQANHTQDTPHVITVASGRVINFSFSVQTAFFSTATLYLRYYAHVSPLAALSGCLGDADISSQNSRVWDQISSIRSPSRSTGASSSDLAGLRDGGGRGGGVPIGLARVSRVGLALPPSVRSICPRWNEAADAGSSEGLCALRVARCDERNEAGDEVTDAGAEMKWIGGIADQLSTSRSRWLISSAAAALTERNRVSISTSCCARAASSAAAAATASASI